MSTVRIRGNSNVNDNAGDGVLVENGSAVEFSTFGGGTTTVSGNVGFGLNCLGAEASFTGVTTGIAANGAGTIAAACTGF
jgi:hypothetical protein